MVFHDVQSMPFSYIDYTHLAVVDQRTNKTGGIAP